MTAAVYRSTPSFSLPQTQNSALVLEFNCLYTHDIRRKQKRWQDGFLRYHTFNKRVMLYDVPRNFIGDTHWKADEALQDGDEVTLEKGGVRVQVAEAVGKTETDLTELRKSRTKSSSERGSSPPARGPQTPAPRVGNVSSSRAPTQLKHRSLNALLGTPRGPIGKAGLPAKSPFELRHANPENENEEWEQGRPPKRRRMENPAAWNVTRTTTANPTPEARNETPLWARTADAAKQKKKQKAPLPLGQKSLATRDVVDLREDEPEPERFLPGFSSDALVPPSSPLRMPAPVGKQQKSVRSSSPAFQTQQAPTKRPTTATHDSSEKIAAPPPNDDANHRRASAERSPKDAAPVVGQDHLSQRSDVESPKAHRSDPADTPRLRTKPAANKPSSTIKGSILRISATAPKKKTLVCQEQLGTKPRRISSTNTEAAADRLLDAASEDEEEDRPQAKTQRQLLEERLTRIGKKEVEGQTAAEPTRGRAKTAEKRAEPDRQRDDDMPASGLQAPSALQLDAASAKLPQAKTQRQLLKDRLARISHKAAAKPATEPPQPTSPEVEVETDTINVGLSNPVGDDEARLVAEARRAQSALQLAELDRMILLAEADSVSPQRKRVKETSIEDDLDGTVAVLKGVQACSDADEIMKSAPAPAPAPTRKTLGVGRREIRTSAQSCFQKPTDAEPESPPLPQREDRQFRRVVSETTNTNNDTTAAVPKRIPGAPMRFTPSPSKKQRTAIIIQPQINTNTATSPASKIRPDGRPAPRPMSTTAPKKPFQRAVSLNMATTGTSAVLLARPFQPPKPPSVSSREGLEAPEEDVAPLAEPWSREAFDLFAWRPPGWCEERWCLSDVQDMDREEAEGGGGQIG
ncbi:hypothetical protein LTR36_009705 [Oleoguttula mirabilis]|uniref:5'-3' DNA helicase ZGRF1-like N-terminal domain-containing protein n=1 Tax=Oleoguttula mirabilis TaxID=1507867 RepID=A0AAV9J726_9PEZI|nr:hypothetical protein LTR36_009705 [Oleoguttula mirabilis]